jgi:hypothetical protein
MCDKGVAIWRKPYLISCLYNTGRNDVHVFSVFLMGTQKNNEVQVLLINLLPALCVSEKWFGTIG